MTIRVENEGGYIIFQEKYDYKNWEWGGIIFQEIISSCLFCFCMLLRTFPGIIFSWFPEKQLGIHIFQENDRIPFLGKSWEPLYIGTREPHYGGTREPHYGGTREPHYGGTREHQYSGSREPFGVNSYMEPGYIQNTSREPSRTLQSFREPYSLHSFREPYPLQSVREQDEECYNRELRY